MPDKDRGDLLEADQITDSVKGIEQHRSLSRIRVEWEAGPIPQSPCDGERVTRRLCRRGRGGRDLWQAGWSAELRSGTQPGFVAVIKK
jgi:hypothetical protein